MIDIQSGENIVLEVRRHWYILVAETAFLFVLAFVPLAGIWLGSSFDVFESVGDSLPLALFLSGLWLFILWLIFFVVWTNYYLDVWIVTDRRIVYVEQLHLFSRQISECRLDRIQDVTVEVHGLLATFLRFGNVYVQNAAEAERFALQNIPYPNAVKDIIVKAQEHAIQGDIAHRQSGT